MLTWGGVLVTRNSLNSLYSMGAWKCFLKCFALIGQRHTLLFLYFYSVSLCWLLDMHTWGCVRSCAHARTHTHTHTQNNSGIFIHWKFARAKKRNKVQCLWTAAEIKTYLTHVFTHFILFRTAESISEEKLIKKMQGVKYLLLEF